MPGFFYPTDSVSKLQAKAMMLYNCSNFIFLNLGGNFRLGLRAIISAILSKMTEAELEQCEESFKASGLVNQNLLYFAEIAHQLATERHYKDVYDWHYKAALYYSRFLSDYILPSRRIPEENKIKLNRIFDDIIQLQIDRMLLLDPKRFETILSGLEPHGYLSRLLHVTHCKSMTKGNESSALTSTPLLHSSGERSVLSFFNQATLLVTQATPSVIPIVRAPLVEEVQQSKRYQHNPYAANS